MPRKTIILAAGLLALASCASSQPRIIQSSGNNQDVHIAQGMATQIEMPDNGRVQTMTVGNPGLVDASQSGDVVTLLGKDKAGETNLIIRARDDSGDMHVYQYHVTVDSK
jgi:hypothetical protein